MRTPLRSLVLALSITLSSAALHAQVLLVNDNDDLVNNPYNTDSLASNLTAAGIVVDRYDISTEGMTPPYEFMLDYDAVIWYCAGDGVNLGLWDAQLELADLVSLGRPVWFIGTDMLYALYGSAPVTFEADDFPQSVMGVASYDAQSYGDDAGVGCPALDVAPAVAADFDAQLQWVFTTMYWVDACTPMPTDVDVIYAMGPAGYVLEGAPAMVHNHLDGVNVMSSFFDPVRIDTYEHRVSFLQNTMDYLLQSSTGVAAHASVAALTVRPDEHGGAWITCGEALRSVEVRDAAGRLEYSAGAGDRQQVALDAQHFASGLHIVSALTTTGTRAVAKWVRP